MSRSHRGLALLAVPFAAGSLGCSGALLGLSMLGIGLACVLILGVLVWQMVAQYPLFGITFVVGSFLGLRWLWRSAVSWMVAQARPRPPRPTLRTHGHAAAPRPVPRPVRRFPPTRGRR